MGGEAGSWPPTDLLRTLMRSSVPRREGRRIFGGDPTTYDRARLDYPERVFAVLRSRCGLGPGTRVFEVGPGTGIATRALLELGANPVTAIEPDRRMSRYLRNHLGRYRDRVRVVVQPFESVRLPPASFDLGVAATSFHWISERKGVRKVARLLRPGGWWAVWGTTHGNPSRRSPFQDALQPLYRAVHGRASRKPTLEQLRSDLEKRLETLRSGGDFERASTELIRWRATLTAERVTAIWSTFADVIALPSRRRRWFLDELHRIAQEQFAGRVEIPMLTPLYTARRTSA